jgi:hypothetical protein
LLRYPDASFSTWHVPRPRLGLDVYNDMTHGLWTALFAVVAALATFAGGFVATFPGRLSHERLSHLIAFGAGYILSAALVSLLPESLHLLDNAAAVCPGRVCTRAPLRTHFHLPLPFRGGDPP